MVVNGKLKYKEVVVDKYVSEVDIFSPMEKGKEYFVVAGTSSGKALKNGTKVFTPKGLVAIEQLNIGDEIFGEDGQIYYVTGVFPQGKKQVWQIGFNQKRIVECCEEHLWNWQSYHQRYNNSNYWQTSTLLELSQKSLKKEEPSRQSGRKTQHRRTIYIPKAKTMLFKEQEVICPPYLLGVLLGDGSLSTSISKKNLSSSVILTTGDKEMEVLLKKDLDNLDLQLSKHSNKYGYGFIRKDGLHHKGNPLTAALKTLNLIGTKSETKFIPPEYKYNSEEVRVEILRGLIDTDGYVHKSGYDFSSASKQLAEDVKFIAETLGCTITTSIKEASYRKNGQKIKCKPSYRLAIKPSKDTPLLCKLSRKKINFSPSIFSSNKIEFIRQTEDFAEMTCISTSNPTKLFVLEGGIVTHNSKATIVDLPKSHNVAVCSPFIMLNKQFMKNNPLLQIFVGTKPDPFNVLPANGCVTSYHSIPRLLEIPPNTLEYLIVDEFHYMVSFAGFATKVIQPFFETVDELRKRHPDLIVIYLTATPAFLEPFVEFRQMECINISVRQPKAKPTEILVQGGLSNNLKRDDGTYICLFNSKKRGLQWAQKYSGAYIAADVDQEEQNYAALIEGDMPTSRVFCSVVLSTGLSINAPVDTLYTSWTNIVDIVQFAARPRQGTHKLVVQSRPMAWLERFAEDPGEADPTSFTYEQWFIWLHKRLSWYSMIIHQDEGTLYDVLETMIYKPTAKIDVPDWLIEDFKILNGFGTDDGFSWKA